MTNINKNPVSIVAVGASAPTVFKICVLAPMVFGKFLTFASIFIEMTRKMKQI